MRKRLITPIPQDAPLRDEEWLDLDGAAVVEVKLIFDQPQRLTRIALVFEETAIKRTQEFVLRWSPDGGRSFRDIVRQQWNFSPPDTVREVEEYQVELSDVTVLELIIVPNNSSGAARASLKNLRLSCLVV